MALEYSTVPAYCLSSKDAVETSLYEALEATGHRPVRALQRLRAILFDEEQCELLRLQPGSPGLLIERRGFLRDGRSVEVTQSYYRGDTYDFVAELSVGSAETQGGQADG
jgi:GntR family transcriptional regulator